MGADIKDHERAEALLAGENRLLEMIATGAPLGETLDALCRLVERMSPEWLASILLVDCEADSVWHGAAPTLPEGYLSAIDGTRGGFQMSSPRNVRTRSGDDKAWRSAELPADETMPIPRWIASIRGNVNIVLSAGGLAAAFLGSRSAASGWPFWVAVAAFALIALLTIVVYSLLHR